MNTLSKVMKLDQVLVLRRQWAENGETTVFTNGCFDILHRGHVDYLEKARSLGDHLIVGLNTDDSIREIKGLQRPVMEEEGRAVVLAGLAAVDVVILFSTPTPQSLISAIMPDILVKGGDYLAENIVGADIVKKNGGKIITIPLVEGYSTSQIIEKIKRNNKT